MGTPKNSARVLADNAGNTVVVQSAARSPAAGVVSDAVDSGGGGASATAIGRGGAERVGALGAGREVALEGAERALLALGRRLAPNCCRASSAGRRVPAGAAGGSAGGSAGESVGADGAGGRAGADGGAGGGGLGGAAAGGGASVGATPR